MQLHTNSTRGREKIKGPYAIVDGGYHKWRHLMSASRLISDPDFVAWRERLESIHKFATVCGSYTQQSLRCVLVYFIFTRNVYSRTLVALNCSRPKFE